MRFIGNNHAIHFGGVTFVNRLTLVKYVNELLARSGKGQEEIHVIDRMISESVDRMEEELRNELRQKHYHADLHIPPFSE